MSKPAATGEMAGVVKVARAGTTVDMGPPPGEEIYDRDAIILDYFLARLASLPTPQPWTRFRRSSVATHLTRLRFAGSIGSWRPSTAPTAS
jgi:hypothetical protein